MAFRWIGKSADGKTVTLQQLDMSKPKFPDYYTPEWSQRNSDLLRVGVALDVETTGLSHNDDSIIEIALRQFIFNRTTGEVLALGQHYSGFQDPEKPLSKEISSLTGITDDMLEGQIIDWAIVNSLLSESVIIIAHNARFDRPFVDKKSKISAEKVWACSMKQIDWSRKGFFSPKLELLNIYHGFFTESHRALNDVDALLHLLSFEDEITKKTYLHELTQNARRLMSQVIAVGAPFESKDTLKARGYSWDTINRNWSKTIFKDDVSPEINWLEESVYFGPSRAFTRDLALIDGFKN